MGGIADDRHRVVRGAGVAASLGIVVEPQLQGEPLNPSKSKTAFTGTLKSRNSFPNSNSLLFVATYPKQRSKGKATAALHATRLDAHLYPKPSVDGRKRWSLLIKQVACCVPSFVLQPRTKEIVPNKASPLPTTWLRKIGLSVTVIPTWAIYR